MAKKQEAEKELQAKEAELDVVTAPEDRETIESEADSISIEEIKSKISQLTKISTGMLMTKNLAITATVTGSS